MGTPSLSRGYLYLLIGVFLWGIHGPAGRFLAQGGVDMLWVSTVRVLIGGTIFALYLLAKGKLFSIDFKTDWGKIAGLSFVGLFLNTITYHLALNHISGTLLMILENLSPVFVFLFSFFLLKTKPTRQELAALALSMAGMGLIVWGRGTFNFGGTPGSVAIGIIWGLLAGVTFGWYTYFSADMMGRIERNPDAMIAMLFKLFLFSAILMLPFLFRSCPKPDTATEWFWLIEMGIFQSAGAYIFWNLALVYVPANTASVLFLFTIVFTAINEFLFLDLMLNRWIVGGGLLIIAAGRLITRRQKE